MSKNRNLLFVPALFFIFTLLSGCGSNDADTAAQGTQGKPALDMALPKSLTGGAQSAEKPGKLLKTNASGIEGPCAFVGNNDEDPFVNGYRMTRFMVSAVATWTCIGDVLINMADFVPHDGAIYETENDTQSPDYDAEAPTHYSVTDDSDVQTTIRLYYAYDRSAPPAPGTVPQFYISWETGAEGHVKGRLIIDGAGTNPDDRDPEDPTMIRMDFSETDAEKIADMVLRFDEGNHWAEGFRIRVRKDLNANPLRQVFLARGRLEMKAQFLPTPGISEIPTVQMYTVSDRLGQGAAIAEFQDLSLPLLLNFLGGNHLGNYLFTKNDRYFFEDDSDWDWIQKTISTATYRGGRTTPAAGGSWIPFNPSLDMIISALNLDSDYFTGTKCADVNDDCTDLLNAVFVDGFAEQEPNQGADPGDWRSTAIANPVYLETIYPNGQNWDGAFDFIFNP